MEATTPQNPGTLLDRVRSWILLAGAGVVVALAELFGTRFGREPLDAVRMLVVFALVTGAAALHGVYMRRIFTRRVGELEREYERSLSVSKDTFLANVSHGLRTPLTGIVGFAHLLRDASLAHEDRESVDMIIAESAELSRMVDDLVTAAQLDADAISVLIEPVSILEQVEKVCDFMELVGAEVGIDVQDLDVMVDPTHFNQVLRNLVTNAHRHGKPTITVRGTVANGRYVCHVVDQGPGVVADDQDRLFTRFSSSVFGSQFTGAVGLGLAVVAELTARMGCEISYRRIRGETQFVLSMPIAEHQRREMRRIVRPPSARPDPEAPRLHAVSV